MTDEIKQTVVDAANTQPKAGSEADGARQDGDDLDALLAQFDTATKPADTTSPPAAAATTQPDKAVLDELQALKGIATQWQQDKFKTEIGATVKDIRGDMDPETFDDEFVEAWLDARARKDNRLQSAWQQKDANPRQWSRIKSELGREFKKKFDKMPDRSATEDREAVVAAVRGASTKAPPEQAPKLGGMTQAEFQKYTRENFGF